jgi:fructose-1,6-bisphosphatase II
MSEPTLPQEHGPYDPERVLEFEFVRAAENAALNAIHWLGRGEKERGDAAACDAIYGVFDILDIRGEVVIGEGSRTTPPVSSWASSRPGSRARPGSTALDPIDGTTNLSKGLLNSISVIAARRSRGRERHATCPATTVTSSPTARRGRARGRDGDRACSTCPCPRC